MIWVFGLVSLLGFLDAFYLTVKHFWGEVPGCSFLAGCDTVLTSQYSEIFGVPVALFGAIYYLVLLLLTVAYLDRRNKTLLRLALKLTWIGLLVTFWLVFLMAAVLKAWCLYCLVSAASSLTLFALARRLEWELNHKTHT